MFPGQVFGLCRLNPTNRTSQIFRSSVIVGVRTCLPLRGSSGLSPDSLLHPQRMAEGPWNRFTIYAPKKTTYNMLWISCMRHEHPLYTGCIGQRSYFLQLRLADR